MSAKAVILDLDLTMVDTSSLAVLRSNRDWPAVYRAIPGTSVYDGAELIVGACTQQRLAVGLVTTAPKPYCEKVLHHHGLVIPCRICYHDVQKGKQKPYPDQMLLCASRLGVPPEFCVAVGDDPKDIIAGKAAGMITVAATWGSADKNALLASGPDHVVNTPKEFIEMLPRL